MDFNNSKKTSLPPFDHETFNAPLSKTESIFIHKIPIPNIAWPSNPILSIKISLSNHIAYKEKILVKRKNKLDVINFLTNESVLSKPTLKLGAKVFGLSLKPLKNQKLHFKDLEGENLIKSFKPTYN